MMKLLMRSVCKRFIALGLVMVVLLPSVACGPVGEQTVTFHILTGSENRILFDDPNSDEPTILEQFEDDENVEFAPSFQGSVDTMLDIQAGANPYDAVWPASSIWLNLGDSQGVVSQVESIMGTPVVFGIKRSKAEALDWVGTEVTVEEIMLAAESGVLRYMMSSATQSNSGAMAYLGYLYAFAGHPEVLTSTDLHDPEVQEKAKRLLTEVDRTAGASGFLRDLFLENYADFDGMVNNESAIITANQMLIDRGETDLLHVIYPVDGLALADWPLGFVDRGDEQKATLFDKLQDYLLSAPVQQSLLDQGRRTNPFTYPMNSETVDPQVFDPDWGIDLDRVLDPIVMPAGPVVLEALNLYQTSIRKPSFTVLCLDYSDSMNGEGETDLKQAMRIMLDRDESARYFLQRSEGDVTIVIPFNGDVIDIWRADGNDEAALDALLAQVQALDPGGNTNIYGALIAALDNMAVPIENYAPAIILLTDGRSNKGSFEEFLQRWQQGNPDGIPVYSIVFGDASVEQLGEVSDATTGDVYDGREGLIDALRDSFANV